MSEPVLSFADLDDVFPDFVSSQALSIKDMSMEELQNVSLMKLRTNVIRTDISFSFQLIALATAHLAGTSASTSPTPASAPAILAPASMPAIHTSASVPAIAPPASVPAIATPDWAPVISTPAGQIPFLESSAPASAPETVHVDIVAAAVRSEILQDDVDMMLYNADKGTLPEVSAKQDDSEESSSEDEDGEEETCPGTDEEEPPKPEGKIEKRYHKLLINLGISQALEIQKQLVIRDKEIEKATGQNHCLRNLLEASDNKAQHLERQVIQLKTRYQEVVDAGREATAAVKAQVKAATNLDAVFGEFVKSTKEATKAVKRQFDRASEPFEEVPVKVVKRVIDTDRMRDLGASLKFVRETHDKDGLPGLKTTAPYIGNPIPLNGTSSTILSATAPVQSSSSGVNKRTLLAPVKRMDSEVVTSASTEKVGLGVGKGGVKMNKLKSREGKEKRIMGKKSKYYGCGICKAYASDFAQGYQQHVRNRHKDRAAESYEMRLSLTFEEALKMYPNLKQ